MEINFKYSNYYYFFKEPFSTKNIAFWNVFSNDHNLGNYYYYYYDFIIIYLN